MLPPDVLSAMYLLTNMSDVLTRGIIVRLSPFKFKVIGTGVKLDPIAEVYTPGKMLT